MIISINYVCFSDIVPATDTSFKVSMSPWSNYTFRVIARNKVGESLPSGHSKTCLTPEDVPFKNPDNVLKENAAAVSHFENFCFEFQKSIYDSIFTPKLTYDVCI